MFISISKEQGKFLQSVSWGFGSETQGPASEDARIPLKINNIFNNIKRQTNILMLLVPLRLLCAKLLVQIFYLL